MTRIALFSGDISRTGGTERVSLFLADNFIKQGYEVLIISLSGSSIPVFNTNSKIKTISLFKRKWNFSILFFLVVYKLRNFIRNEKIDILIDVDTILSLYSALSLFGLNVKHISWEHFNYQIDFNMIKRRLARKIAAKYADCVVTLTERDRDFWINNSGYPDKIVSIPNPLPFKALSQCEKKDTKTILALGRLSHQKGFDLLIDIWAKIEKVNDSWKLIIAGDGEEYAFLSHKITELKLSNIKIIPSTLNVNDLYNESCIYVMTSRFEGFPMVLLEAKAFGLPIVAYDCNTGPAEMICDNEDGFLILYGDDNEFVEKLLLLMNDSELRESMSAKSLDSSKYYIMESSIQGKWDKILENNNI
ncbi:glycosyltransferase family 4 protein [Yersinia mollaretii]|uniref:glycosyltransferase family 4 protein n=2 Tax=Yersinia mollaretii TaxID=33060 RepID=UPI0005DC6AFF|nr:glycosyltransferase family 4 protein [Yersinia mollaretii]MDN0111187.1 glycosyltransferase family 4 protein [Yersinia mollaretii]PJE89561.1 glycosyltransferase family 4 protein [Yersinia mollaretii]CQH00814.1 WbcM protein [Yersinia mollaretii]